LTTPTPRALHARWRAAAAGEVSGLRGRRARPRGHRRPHQAGRRSTRRGAGIRPTRLAHLCRSRTATRHGWPQARRLDPLGRLARRWRSRRSWWRGAAAQPRRATVAWCHCRGGGLSGAGPGGLV